MTDLTKNIASRRASHPRRHRRALLTILALAFVAFTLPALAAPMVAPDDADATATAVPLSPLDAIDPRAFLDLPETLAGTDPDSADGDVPATHTAAAATGSGRSLRAVARSILTVDPSGQLQSRRAPASAVARSPFDDSEETRKGVAETLLDSELLGSALQAAVQITGVDGSARILSIFGVGNFEADMSGGTPGVSAVDRSDGFAAGPFGDAADAAPANDVAAPPREPVNLLLLPVQFLFEFLATPFGMILAIVAAIYLLLSTIIRLGGFVRQRKVPHPRPPRQRLQHHRHRRKTHRSPDRSPAR